MQNNTRAGLSDEVYRRRTEVNTFVCFFKKKKNLSSAISVVVWGCISARYCWSQYYLRHTVKDKGKDK